MLIFGTNCAHLECSVGQTARARRREGWDTLSSSSSTTPRTQRTQLKLSWLRCSAVSNNERVFPEASQHSAEKALRHQYREGCWLAGCLTGWLTVAYVLGGEPGATPTAVFMIMMFVKNLRLTAGWLQNLANHDSTVYSYYCSLLLQPKLW